MVAGGYPEQRIVGSESSSRSPEIMSKSMITLAHTTHFSKHDITLWKGNFHTHWRCLYSLDTGTNLIWTVVDCVASGERAMDKRH